MGFKRLTQLIPSLSIMAGALFFQAQTVQAKTGIHTVKLSSTAGSKTIISVRTLFSTKQLAPGDLVKSITVGTKKVVGGRKSLLSIKGYALDQRGKKFNTVFVVSPRDISDRIGGLYLFDLTHLPNFSSSGVVNNVDYQKLELSNPEKVKILTVTVTVDNEEDDDYNPPYTPPSPPSPPPYNPPYNPPPYEPPYTPPYDPPYNPPPYEPPYTPPYNPPHRPPYNPPYNPPGGGHGGRDNGGNNNPGCRERPQQSVACSQYAGQFGIPARATEGTASLTKNSCSSVITYTGGCSEPARTPPPTCREVPQSPVACSQYAGQYGIPSRATEGSASWTKNSCSGAITYTGGCSEPARRCEEVPQSPVSCSQYAGQYGIPSRATEGSASWTKNSCSGAISYTGGCSEPAQRCAEVPQSPVSCAQYAGQYGIPAGATSGSASWTKNSCTGDINYTGGCY